MDDATVGSRRACRRKLLSTEIPEILDRNTDDEDDISDSEDEDPTSDFLPTDGSDSDEPLGTLRKKARKQNAGNIHDNENTNDETAFLPQLHEGTMVNENNPNSHTPASNTCLHNEQVNLNDGPTSINGNTNQGERLEQFITQPTIAIVPPIDFSAETETQPPAPKKRNITPKSNPGRKRVRDAKNWKRNLNKKAKDTGQPYTTKAGQHKEAKSMGPGCGVNCRYRCKDKISFDQRESLFKEFWKIGEHTRQWDFVLRNVTKVNRKQKKVDNSRRSCSLTYSLRVGGEVTKVCKTMFLHTLAINDMWVRTALLKQGETSGISPDKRGKHSNRGNAINEATKQSVRDHIETFPAVESHYVRKRTSRKYLEPGLDVKKMHRLYIEWISDKNVRPATERQYRDLFNTEFNIGFFMPKKDQCEDCSAYRLATEAEKETLQGDYDKHIKMKTAARNSKDADKEAAKTNKELCVSCVDLEQVLQTPKSEVSVFYYKRKFSTYNLTLYDLADHEGFCYVWHQAIAKRGAIEIASCIFTFLQAQASRGKKEIIIYSDNCGGQNRNRFVFAMYQHAIQVLPLQKITHKFLEKGHTQNEGDSMHACIEHAKKGVEVFTPNQWVMLIKRAKVTGKPYNVTEMSQKDFFDFKALIQQKNWATAEDDTKVYWSKVCQVWVCKDDWNKIKLTYEYNGNTLTMDTNAVRQRRGRPASKGEVQRLAQKYAEPIAVPKAKLKDLLDVCEKGLVPSVYHDFYKGLNEGQTSPNDSDSDS